MDTSGMQDGEHADDSPAGGWDDVDWNPLDAWAREEFPEAGGADGMPAPGARLSAGQLAEMELRSHFEGKRAGPRTRCDLEVVLRGRAGRFAARTIDLSRSGVLLRITDPLYARLQGNLAAFAETVERHFRTRIDVRFVEAGIHAAAEVARLTVSSAEQHGEDGWLLMACRFRTPLTFEQCDRLGIDPGMPN